MPDQTILRELIKDGRVKAFEVTGSTNEDAKKWFLEDGRPGDIVIADKQTMGKGRKGHSFCSNDGGLYMTLLLKEEIPAGMITCITAVAVRQAILDIMGIDTSIKWVNDVLKDGMKVCGILCESLWSGNGLIGQVCGIGLNLYQEEFPDELKQIAASLKPGTRTVGEKEKIVAAVRKNLMYGLLEQDAAMKIYKENCITVGQNVMWDRDGLLHYGYAKDINKTGGLIITEMNGKDITIEAGEVSVRPTLRQG